MRQFSVSLLWVVFFLVAIPVGLQAQEPGFESSIIGKATNIVGLEDRVAVPVREETRVAVALSTTTSTASQPLPSPSVGPLSSCCICTYPNPGERDSDEFNVYCQQCYIESPEWLANCDREWNMTYGDLPALVEAGEFSQCKSPLTIKQINHGINDQAITEVIEACITYLPECSVNLDTNACSALAPGTGIEEFLQDLRERLSPGQTITVCGAQTDLMFKVNCLTGSIFKRYVVNISGVRSDVGNCAESCSFCHVQEAAPQTVECKDIFGVIRKQTCCAIEGGVSAGFWGDFLHGCSACGRSTSCPAGCGKLRIVCDGTVRVASECVTNKVNGKKLCLSSRSDCKDAGLGCKDDDGCVTTTSTSISGFTVPD